MPRLIYCLFLKGRGDPQNSCASRQELLRKQGAECWAQDSSHSSKRRVEWCRTAWQTAGKDCVCCLALLERQDLFQQTLLSEEALPWWKSLPFSHKHTTRNLLDYYNALIIWEPVWLEPENRHFSCHDIPAPSTWHGEGSERAHLSVSWGLSDSSTT